MPGPRKTFPLPKADSKPSKSKNYGERTPLTRGFKIKKWIRDSDWADVEKLANLKFKAKTRKKIELYSQLYGCFGPIYDPRRSVLTADALAAIRVFQNACQNLAKKLLSDDFDIEALLPELTRRKLPSLRSKRLTSTGKVIGAAIAAEIFCQLALEELDSDSRNGRIHHDLWAAWACLVSKAFEADGFKISGSSIDRALKESPAIKVIERLQDCLPRECRRLGGYESIRVSLQEVNDTFEKLSEVTLIQIIGGWGSQLLPGYPGPLRSLSRDDIAEFESYARQVRAQLESQAKQKRKSDS